MEDDLFEIILVLSMFGAFFAFVVAIIIISRGMNYSLKYNSARGNFELFKGSRKIFDLARSDLQEIALSTYRTTGSKNNQTYYNYGFVIGDDLFRRIVASYPKFSDVTKDGEAIRVFSATKMIQTRQKAEALCKSSGLPLRSLNGELRQATDLDRPYHEFMRGKIELTGFPPRYREGDDFEVVDGREEYRIIVRNKKFYGSWGTFIIFLLLGFFYFGIGNTASTIDFDNFDVFEAFFMILIHLPLVIVGSGIVYYYLKTKYFSDVVISNGILKIGLTGVKLAELEDVHSNGMRISLITDKKVFNFGIIAYVPSTKLEEYTELIKKSIVYKALR